MKTAKEILKSSLETRHFGFSISAEQMDVMPMLPAILSAMEQYKSQAHPRVDMDKTIPKLLDKFDKSCHDLAGQTIIDIEPENIDKVLKCILQDQYGGAIIALSMMQKFIGAAQMDSKQTIVLLNRFVDAILNNGVLDNDQHDIPVR